MDCQICSEKFNRSTRIQVECICGEICCRSCLKKYIQSKSEDPHCMFCRVKWNLEFMSKHFEKNYISKEYRDYRENILYEKELGFLPATQPLVEKQIKIETIESEMSKLETEKYEMLRKYNEQIRNKQRDINELKSKTTEKRRYVRKCPNNDCHGFLSTQLKCELCSSWVCSHCREIKGNQQDSPHTCDPQILESIQFLNNDTKPCPNCSALIYKIEGCSQMFCTECHVAFNWNTLRIETGIIHNPHYFEWRRQRRNNEANEIERNPNDVLCGRELDANFNNLLSQKYIREYNNDSLPNKLFLDTIKEILHSTMSIHQTHYHNEILNAINETSGHTRYIIAFKDETKRFTYAKMIIGYIESREKQYHEVFSNTMNQLAEFPIVILLKKLKILENIIQRTIHIRQYELPRWNNPDRLANNEYLRVKFMRNLISEEEFKKEIQIKDKALQKNTDFSNILRMYISCITDLFYRLYENTDQYDEIIKEMHELRKYTNTCMENMFKVYSSTMKHHIDDNFIYI